MNGTKKLSIYCVNASSFNMFKNSIDDVTVLGCNDSQQTALFKCTYKLETN